MEVFYPSGTIPSVTNLLTSLASIPERTNCFRVLIHMCFSFYFDFVYSAPLFLFLLTHYKPHLCLVSVYYVVRFLCIVYKVITFAVVEVWCGNIEVKQNRVNHMANRYIKGDPKAR